MHETDAITEARGTIQPFQTGAPVPSPRTATPASPATLERDEIRRMVTRSMRIGMWVWPSFTVVDAWMCFVAYPNAPFPLFVVYRVVVELAMVGVYRASRR